MIEAVTKLPNNPSTCCNCMTTGSGSTHSGQLLMQGKELSLQYRGILNESFTSVILHKKLNLRHGGW
jgi:hypothetical protein